MDLPRMGSIVSKLATERLQRRRNLVVGSASSHANVHLDARRSKTAAQVAEQSSRYRAVFVTPPDSMSRLHATLELTEAEHSLPPRESAAVRTAVAAVEWQGAIICAGVTAAAASVSRVSALAAMSATAAANTLACSSSSMLVDGDNEQETHTACVLGAKRPRPDVE